MFRFALLAGLLLGTAAVATAGETPSPAGAAETFVGLEDGATVKSPLTIHFGLEGMSVAPAGTATEASGHHHLLIDAAVLTGDELNEPIPADDQHKHFGKGQTETTIELSPGKHTLQLVLGDANHIPHNPPVMSKRITVTVE